MCSLLSPVTAATFCIEPLPDVFQTTGYVTPHHAGTDPHALGYVIDRDFVYTMQQKCLSAFGWELGYCGSKNEQILFTGYLSLRRDLKHGEIDISHRGDMGAPTTLAQAINRQIGRRLEQEGAQIADGFRMIQLQKMDIRFLSDLPGLLLGTHLCRDESQQGGVVLAKQPLDITRFTV
jgi:hypothetical protein